MIGGVGLRRVWWAGGWDKAWEMEHNVWSMVQSSLQKHQPNEQTQTESEGVFTVFSCDPE